MASNHLVFCCGGHCKDYLIRRYMNNNQAILHNRDNVRIGDDRYIFIIDVNRNIDRIMGLRFGDYICCEHYVLSDEVCDHLYSRHAGMFGDEIVYDEMNRWADFQVIEAFNKQVSNSGWTSSRATYLNRIHNEIKRRYDYSVIDVGGMGISFAHRIKLVGNKIEVE